ncbi:uncharacterized protein HD556DRAFT_1306747 [Suillus plorans]|uniref:Uncharacterized protein n=1 Tax=Suillus plorans TaxID=116603 RepID=A0A9P7DKI5_9AGAM|nr:uncharacterized protein HD556DRAFT_1306747 [Suillus plorans]KAG1797051.1 hypothetical protein HD556DRAFT_1306747 [Suillus plorans]
MSSHTNKTKQILVLACFYSFAEPNRFLEVCIKAEEDGQIHLTRPHIYFQDEANVKEDRIAIADEEFDEPTLFSVFYDSTLHGTPHCPYLVFKITNKTDIVDILRKDYIAMTKAVEQMETSKCILSKVNYLLQDNRNMTNLNGDLDKLCAELQCMIMDHLALPDLIELGKTRQENNEGAFIEDTSTFIGVIECTGSIIAGSSALHLFQAKSEALALQDLDIYATQEFEETLLEHFKGKEGYKGTQDNHQEERI